MGCVNLIVSDLPPQILAPPATADGTETIANLVVPVMLTQVLAPPPTAPAYGTEAWGNVKQIVPAILTQVLAPATAVGTETIANLVVPPYLILLFVSTMGVNMTLWPTVLRVNLVVGTVIQTPVLAPATAVGTEARVKQIVPTILRTLFTLMKRKKLNLKTVASQ